MNNNIYLLSNLQDRINLLEAGDINNLRWDPDEYYNIDEWLLQIRLWDSAELHEILIILRDKVVKILSRGNILINVNEEEDFLSIPGKASQQRIEQLNLKRREELIHYKAFLQKCIELIDIEVERNLLLKETQTSQTAIVINQIHHHLKEFKGKNFTNDDYDILVKALALGFESGTFHNLPKPISVFGIRPPKKLGVPFKRIFMDCSVKKNLTFEYLNFAKINLSVFFHLGLDQNNLTGSPLYSCFTKEQ